MKPSILLRIVFTVILYTALTGYIGWNLHFWLSSAFQFDHFLVVVGLTMIVGYSYIIARFIKKFTIFRIVGAYWFAVVQYALLLLPVANLVGWLLIMLGLNSEHVVVGTGIVVLVGFAVIFAYGTYNAYTPIVRKFDIEVKGKQTSHSSIKIAVASDMHFGHLSGRSHARRLVKEMKSLSPDLILLPGDIIDDDPEPFITKGFGDIISGLSAPLGVYGVLGNHEYYGGGIPTYLEEMKRIGIPILMDEVVNLTGDIQLVGRKDKTDRHRKSMEHLLADLDADKPVFVMDHQPLELLQAAEHGADIIVSGHTHRGQMAPNHWVTRRIFELDWGYLQKQQLHAFVSSGFGFWGPPLRIGSRSEIVFIEVTFN